MKRAKLKEKIAFVTGRTDTLNALAEVLGKTPAAVGYQMRGECALNAKEIDAIRVAYHLTNDEVVDLLIEGEREA